MSSLGWKSEVQWLNKAEYFTFTFIFLFFFSLFFFFLASPSLSFCFLKRPRIFYRCAPGGFSAGFHRCVPGGCDADPAAFERGWDPPLSPRELSASSCSLRAKRFSVPEYLKSSGKGWELRGRERALPGGRSCGRGPANAPGSACSEAEP